MSEQLEKEQSKPEPQNEPSADFLSAENEKESSFSEILAEIIKQNREVIHEGHSGLILKFKPEQLSLSQKEELERRGVVFESDVAVKALKIFDLVSGRKEFEMLKAAHQVLARQKDGQEMAGVPTPLSFETVEIDSEVREYLRTKGAALDDKMAVILMDYIEGEDMATFLYKNVLRLSGQYGEDLINSLTFRQLHTEAGIVLGYQKPGKKGSTEGERYFEEAIVNARNVDKLIKFLKTKGFVLDPKILEKIKRIVEVFHDNDIFHNDLHERNVIIANPYMDPGVFVVDFGSATNKLTESTDRTYKISDDYDIIRRLSPLTENAEEEIKKQKEAKFSRLDELTRRIPTDPETAKLYTKFKDALSKDAAKSLENYFILSLTTDRDLDNFTGIIINSVNDGILGKEQTVAFIKEKLNQKKVRPFVKNRLSDLLEYLEIRAVG